MSRSPRRIGAVLVLLTTEEREIIRKAAKQKDRSMSGYLRIAGIDAARKRKVQLSGKESSDGE